MNDLTRQAVALSPRLLDVIRTAKRDGILRAMPQECLRYNHVRAGESYDVVEAGPRENGHYDVEGLTSCDVVGYWQLRWWHPGDVWALIGGTARWVLETIDLFGPRRLLRHASEWRNLASWVVATWPLTTWQQGWVWTIDPLSVMADEAAYDVAEETVEERRPPVNHPILRTRAIEEVRARVRPTITREQVLAYMADQSYVQVDEYMWVSSVDPTVFVFDEARWPFDMKDGWSYRALEHVLGYWYGIMVHQGGREPVVRIDG
jgi:hypothetical protein